MVLSEKQVFGGSDCYLWKTVERRVTSVRLVQIFKGENKQSLAQFYHKFIHTHTHGFYLHTKLHFSTLSSSRDHKWEHPSYHISVKSPLRKQWQMHH